MEVVLKPPIPAWIASVTRLEVAHGRKTPKSVILGRLLPKSPIGRVTPYKPDWTVYNTVLQEMKTIPEISEFNFGDGDIALVVELPIPPFEVVSIASEDISAGSRNMLEELVQGWGSLWPDMLERLQDSLTRYGCDQVLGRDDFMGSISRMSTEFYMGDKSDYMLRFEFDEPPLWDFFFKDNQIIHFQPVF